MKWIMVANSNDCRIYEYDKHINQLSLIDEINHPENRLRNHDLDSDRPGHYKAKGTGRGSYSPEVTSHDSAIDDFAREMAKRLNTGRNRHEYDSLVLLMSSTMEGLLMKHLKKQIWQLVQQVIQKNVMHLNEHQLKHYLAHVMRQRAVLH